MLGRKEMEIELGKQLKICGPTCDHIVLICACQSLAACATHRHSDAQVAMFAVASQSIFFCVGKADHLYNT